MDLLMYELVISDPAFGNRPAGRNVLAYARVKEYRPATGVVSSSELFPDYLSASGAEMSIHTENLPNLLEDIAELIGARARRRSVRYAR